MAWGGATDGADTQLRPATAGVAGSAGRLAWYSDSVRILVMALLMTACGRVSDPEVLPADATTGEAATDSSVPADTDSMAFETGLDVGFDSSAVDTSDTLAADGATDAIAEASDTAAVDGDAVSDSDAADAGPTLLATISGVRDVAAGGGFVFVTSFDGAILRIPRDGGAAIKIASPEYPTYVAVDATHVYWTDLRKSSSSSTGKVGRVPIGGGPEELLADGLSGPNSCTLSGADVFFAELASVQSVPRVGGTIPTTVAAALTYPYYVAANTTSICWAEGGNRVVCRPRAGGPSVELVTGTSSTIYFLAIDETHAFYALGAGSLMRVPLAGGAPATLAPGVDNCLYGADIELDDTRVYWSCGPNVRVVPKAGGAVTVLAKESAGTFAIAIDATRVYWTTRDGALRYLPR